MTDSFKNMLLLDEKKLSLAGVSSLDKPENQFPVPGTKHSLKNTFPLYNKSASSGKKIEENGFH